MIKFQHTWGGKDTWYTKAKMWARNQKYPWNQIYKAIIEWVWEKWVAGKVQLEMASVDKQAEELVKQWEEEDDEPRWKLEERLSDVDGLPTLSISSTIVERGTDESSSSVDTTGNEEGLHDQVGEDKIEKTWYDVYDDWNDAVLGWEYESRKNSGTVGEGQQY